MPLVLRPEDDLGPAVEALRRGGLVAFPTETVYGLGARADDATAIARIFAAKGRPADNPLIVHVADVAAARPLAAEWTEAAERLAKAFWPGPLTLVVTRGSGIDAAVAPGLDSVALRVPDQPLALALLRRAGAVAAPSANRSGRPSPTRADHVLDDLGDAVDAVIDGGACRGGIESTVVDVRGPEVRVLRPGAVSVEALRTAGVAVASDASDEAVVASPGTRHEHYRPRARVVLVEGDPAAVLARVRHAVASDETVHGLALGDAPASDRLVIHGDLDDFAADLYAALRRADAAGAEAVWVGAVPREGLGLALMDRLERAARDRVRAD